MSDHFSALDRAQRRFVRSALSAGLATGLISTATVCAAQAGNDKPLEPVTVTATRRATPVANSLSDVTIIDAQAIADAGAQTLPELLQSQGGIEISETGGAARVSGLYMRGTKTAQTVILVDGVRMENPLSGGGNLEFLPLSAIDRIEIVRGPMSSLYGSGAIGGVVQIFTRQGEGPARVSASIAGGSQGTAQLSAGVRGSAGDQGATRYSLNLSGDRSDGYEITRQGSPAYQADRDGYRRFSVTGQIAHRITRDWDVGVNLLSSSGSAHYDDAYSTSQDAVWHFDSRAVSAYLTGKPVDGWETTLRAGLTRIDYHYDAFTFAPETETRTLSWQNSWRLPLGRILAGAETIRQSIDGDGVGASAGYLHDRRSINSMFAGYELEQGAHLLRAQIRRDQIQTVGGETTGQLGYGYRLNSQWLVRASGGSAFRAPTFDDLYNPFGSNPDLKPERSVGYELAAERRQGASFLKITGFTSRIRDAIELDAMYVPQNLATARVRGVSVEARQPIGGGFTARANITLQHAEGTYSDPMTGAQTQQRLARRARHHGVAALDYRGGPWRGSISAVFQGDRVDAAQEPMGGYVLLNLSAAYAITRQWELFGMLGNLTNRHYQTAYGFEGRPRNLLIGVRFASL